MADFLSNPIVAMVLMLGGLVLFHELGHFIVGRLCGVAVETFSIGFGATIFAKKIKSTTFQISWLPLGGFVKFYGASRNEDVPDDLDGAVYHSAPIWKRGLIIAAGPAANFLLAFVIFWIMVMVGMEVPPPTVGDVIEKSRAQAAGIMPGDRFLEVDGESVKAWSDIERKISRSPEIPLKVKVLRSGLEQELTLVPEKVEGVSLFGSKAKIGRAGIALGYPSAVVTVLDDKSVLGQSGLRTTDRIDSYVDSSGQTVKINGFHDLLALFQVWKKSGLQKIDWNVQTVKVTLDKDGRPKEAAEGTLRKISVDVSTWPDVGGLSERAYGSKLGVSDSHLTVAVPQSNTAETLKMGDHLLEWNGQLIKTIYHLQELMMDNKTPTAEVKVSRQGFVETLTVALKSTDLQKPEGMVTIFVLDAVMLGMSGMPSPSLIQYKNPIKAAGVAIAEGYSQTTMMISSFWAIITGELPIKALGGPILIAKVASDSAKAGFMAFFATMAVISINLAIVNLFPIPVLDGGQLVMLTAERLKGAPLGEQTIENFHKLGFVVVLCLIILAMYNDLSRFWTTMISSVMGSIN